MAKANQFVRKGDVPVELRQFPSEEHFRKRYAREKLTRSQKTRNLSHLERFKPKLEYPGSQGN